MPKRMSTDALALLLALPAPVALCAGQSPAAQPPRTQHLRPLSAAEQAALPARLDAGLLPYGAAHRNFDRKQVFNLVGPAGTELTVVPVVYTLPVPEAGTERHTCGAYILPSHGTAYFLDGSPGNDLGIQCWQILAVRLHRNPGAPPDIVFTGSDSLTSHSWSQDYTLSRKDTARYTLSTNFNDIP